MALQVPSKVHEVLGDEAVMAFVLWLDERYVTRERAVLRDEYREVLSRLDGLEKDVSLIKEELFRIRTESREDRAQMRAEFKEGQAQMRAEFQEGQAQMRAEFQEGQAQMRAEFREDLGELRRDMNERFDGMDERFDRMHYQMIVQTRWFIGALTVIGTVVSALLAVAQFTP